MRNLQIRMEEVVNTVFKMSPPWLLMLGINAVILAIHRFVPERYLTLLCIMLGGVLAPLLIPESSLIWSVPSPMTALVLVGVIFGCLARGAHSRIKAKLTKWGMIYDEDGREEAEFKRKYIDRDPPSI